MHHAGGVPSSGPSGHLPPEGEGKKREGKTLPPREAIEFARNLRVHATDAEQRLWALLRGRHLGGFKFRRQHPLPPYTLDFYCDAARLCVELDGGQHGEDQRDARRDAWLAEQGIRTLRVWNNDVFNDLERVLTAIWDVLQEQPSPQRYALGLRPPLPEGEGSKHRAAIEAAAQGVLDARAQFPDATLADLYDPLSMPPALVKAHQALDRAVDAAYIAAEKAAGRKPPKLGSDAERVAFLFERYQALTSLLPAAKPAKPRRRKAKVET